MIDIELFIDSLSDLTKINQSAYNSGGQVTRAINMSANEYSQYLYSIFEVNQNAVDLALPITVYFNEASNEIGQLTLPADYNHLLSLQYKKTVSNLIKCQRIGINQLGIIEKIPQRRANKAKDRLLYYFVNDMVVPSGGGSAIAKNIIQILPKETFEFVAIYAKLPTPAKIEYTYTMINGEPKRTIGAKINIGFDMNSFNILLYMTMEKLGFSSRDLLVTEYAKLGIVKEEVKPNN